MFVYYPAAVSEKLHDAVYQILKMLRRFMIEIRCAHELS